MVPTPENNDRIPKDNGNEDDDGNYERDGWRIGYEVHMEGVGMVNVYGDTDDGSDSDGYEGPGDVSDAENNEARRAGYQALPSIDEPDVMVDDGEQRNDLSPSGYDPLPTDNLYSSTLSVTPSIQQEFQRMINEASNVHNDLKIEDSSENIELNEDKILVIKSAMSQIQLSMPPWANAVGDKKLTEMLDQIKCKSRSSS